MERSTVPSRVGLAVLTVLMLVVVSLTMVGCSSLDTATDERATGDVTVSSDMGYSPEFGSEDSLAADEAQSLPAPGGAGVDAASIPPAQRLVVRTAGLRIDVDDVEAAVADVRTQALEVSGMVTDVQVSTQTDIPLYRYDAIDSLADGTALSGWVTVRVPAESYDTFVAAVSNLGEVLRQTESESDVTQEHIDLEARLSNLRAQEERLREFTARAEKVEELLAIEQELTRVRAEIDSLEGQTAYLERQAAMSTVTIELIGPAPIVRPQGEDWGFVSSLTEAVRAFVGTINVLIVVTGALLPILIIALVVFLVIRAIIRRRRPDASESPDLPESASSTQD